MIFGLFINSNDAILIFLIINIYMQMIMIISFIKFSNGADVGKGEWSQISEAFRENALYLYRYRNKSIFISVVLIVRSWGLTVQKK